jgi:flagellar biosynthesis protein FlhF
MLYALFNVLPANGRYKLIVTKLDESDTIGAILNIMCNSNAVLSYLAHGQSVPDDIELAHPDKLMGMLLREHSYA